MPRGPFKRTRITSAGPLSYDQEQAPSLPRRWDPPVVTDSFGHVKPWLQWSLKEPFEEEVSEVPPTLSGVSGICFPEKKHCIIDNRSYLHHPGQTGPNITPTFTSGKVEVPDPYEDEFIPFVFDYVSVEGGTSTSTVTPYEEFENRSPWQPRASLPSRSSVMFAEIFKEEGFKTMDPSDTSVESVYDMAFSLRAVGCEPATSTKVTHSIGRGFGMAERNPFLEDLYRELSFDGYLPDPKFERDNEVIRTRRTDI